MEDFHERILSFTQTFYQRALMRADKEEFKKAEFAASAALTTAALLSEDEDTPNDIRTKANILRIASKKLLSEIWKVQVEGYGERFLSGRKSREEKFADECEAELYSAMKEAKKLRNR